MIGAVADVLLTVVVLGGVFRLAILSLDAWRTHRPRIGPALSTLLGVVAGTGVALVRLGLAYIAVRQALRQTGRPR